MNSGRRSVALLAAMLTLGGAAGTAAQEKSISIELNDATNVDGACRIIFVAVNKSGAVIEKMSYDVVTFDATGKVGQSLTFQFGRLQIGKTKVVQFDLAGQTCDKISRLLVNDASECAVAGNASDVCLDALTTTTRTTIEFGL